MTVIEVLVAVTIVPKSVGLLKAKGIHTPRATSTTLVIVPEQEVWET